MSNLRRATLALLALTGAPAGMKRALAAWDGDQPALVSRYLHWLFASPHYADIDHWRGTYQEVERCLQEL
mgnify:CR=1 FL=1